MDLKTSGALSIVGLMSGTSADGVDAALVDVTGSGHSTRLTLLAFVSIPYDRETREAALSLARDLGRPSDVARWHYRLADRYADAVNEVTRGRDLDLVACHGQTVSHLPAESPPATLQLGSPARLAERTGTTVVSDFRAADIAAGGQGAPLACLADDLLLRAPDLHRVALNIGGIANVTYLPPLGTDDDLVAFDTGPGNALIDRAVSLFSQGSQSFDRDGARAASGHVLDAQLEDLMAHPYFQQPPPKSTGREVFGDELVDGLLANRSGSVAPEDLLATLTAFTARSIAVGIRALKSTHEVIVSGGGARNRTLIEMLRTELPSVRFIVSDDLGISADAKEAIAFALLGNQTVRCRPGNVPSCTGAAGPRVLGSITPGRNFGALQVRLRS